MADNISHIALSLKEELKTDTLKGAISLIDFGKKHAVDNKLRYDALILKLNYLKAEDGKGKQKVQQEMLDLVDKIVLDFEKSGASEKINAKQQSLQKLEQHFAQQKPPNDVVFYCKNLGKTYKKSNFSLNDINLELRLGEITSVVGENGNGKTTFFRIVVGELLCDKGSMAYPLFDGGDENNIKWAKVKQKIAYVPQELPSWNGSLKDMLQYEAAIHGIKGKDNIREVNYVVQRLGLEEHLGKNWNQLSGGFKLRFYLAKALVWKPKLLIIDEPLANLDIKTQQLILKDLRYLANSFRYPMAVLVSSQHLHEIEAVSDNILFLKQGKVSFSGQLHELGAERKYNTFELNCDLNLEELKIKFKDFEYRKLYYNGVSYVITTPLYMDYKEILQYLIQKDIEIDYFRNISQSIKQLFEL